MKLLLKNKIEFTGNVKEIEPVVTQDKFIGVRIKDKFIETDLILLSVGFEPE